MKDIEFEKRFLYIERDLIRENKFSIAKSELGKIIHDAKIKNLSEVLDRARELLRFCNSKEHEFSEKIDENNHLSDDEVSTLPMLSQKDIVETEKLIIELKKEIEKFNLMQNVNSITEFNFTLPKRSDFLNKLYNVYNSTNETLFKTELTKLVIQFYTPYEGVYMNIYELQFEGGIHNFVQSFKILRDNEINRLKAIIKDNEDLENLYNKLIKIDVGSFIDEKLRLISKEVKELKYDVPVENMYNFLLDFSEIIPMSTKTDDSTDNEYTLNTGWGPLHFKILEKEPNKKITYMYDFLSSYGEKGTFYIELIEPSSGKVIVKTRNNIQEISKIEREALQIWNFFKIPLKYYLDSSIGKIVAKVVQTTFYEKNFDDLTMGNYRILQAKFNGLGKDINELKARFFEVKTPLTLNSFECSECGATLNIMSKEEKFIICDHCSTPFLMEWQKE